MFDTMTLTKAVAGLCATFLVFMLGGWGAQIIYGTYGSHDHHEQAYIIPVEGAEEEEVEVVEVPFEEVYAMADASAGESLFRACAACHALESGVNGTGPYLHHVVGRDVDTAEGYEYSGALEEVVDVWTPEHLNGFLEDPRGYAPGTNMAYNGMRSVEDRADLIAYLATYTE